ncbi:MAG: Hsp20/alpha crystallin family protein [Steroidobacteraceae bacterium]
MSIVRWEPMRELDEFFRRVSGLTRRPGGAVEGTEWTPAANISESANEYLIKAELPEVNKEDVAITLQNGVITISGERKFKKEDKDENTLRVESFYGSFSRSFALPENADQDNISAETKDGILRVRIPKVPAKTPKAVEIKVQ